MKDNQYFFYKILFLYTTLLFIFQYLIQQIIKQKNIYSLITKAKNCAIHLPIITDVHILLFFSVKE